MKTKLPSVLLALVFLLTVLGFLLLRTPNTTQADAAEQRKLKPAADNVIRERARHPRAGIPGKCRFRRDP
jgi:hypothetical protein